MRQGTPASHGRRASDTYLPALEWQLLKQAFNNLPAMLMVNLSVTLGAVYIIHNDGHSIAYIWPLFVVVLTALRAATGYQFKIRQANKTLADEKTLNFYKLLYGGGLISAALTWDLVALLTFSDMAQTTRYSLIIIISALGSGATGITAPLGNIARIYITLIVLPPSFLLILNSPHDLVTGILGIIFCIAMLVSHASNHKLLRASITLKLENEQLVNNLKYLNTDLERRVSLRTQALKRIAHHDALTGLPNRRGLIEWMEESLHTNNPLEAAILFLDLDRFKQINDALGHDVGDKVLQTIAIRFNDICPKDCILGRWGGDEFLLITQQRPDIRAIVEQLAKKLIDAATAPLEMNNEKLGLGLSVGVAYFPTDACDYKDVIQAADLTVAEVKRNGRGQTLVYNDTYAETQRRRFDLSRSLTEAIEHNRLQLVYQPIVESNSGVICAYEVLCRWQHPVLGDISPNEFIRLAEDTDRIIALGDWVLITACKAALEWSTAGKEKKIAINVSIKQLLSQDFCQHVQSLLLFLNFPIKRLILEVTESLFGEEYLDQALATVTQLHEAGIEVHIDDFGTGYSSLSRLHQFPVAAIKIDRSFVTQLDSQSMVIIESAVMIAKRMQLKVVAEGIETETQAKILTDLGVDKLQGYYFGKPQAIPKSEKEIFTAL